MSNNVHLVNTHTDLHATIPDITEGDVTTETDGTLSDVTGDIPLIVTDEVDNLTCQPSPRTEVTINSRDVLCHYSCF